MQVLRDCTVKPLPWSYSSLSGFATCPNKFYELKVLKNFKDESGEAAQWGSYVHKCIEDAVNGVAPMPENTKVYEQQVWAAIGDLDGVTAETKLAINSKFEPVPWEERWCGSISDILRITGDTALVVDWKLGKRKPTAQLVLNALMVFYNYPEVNTVHTSFEWLQFKVADKDTHTRDQIPALWAKFVPDLTQYVQAFKRDVWQKRSSGLCRNYCVVTTCEHCGQYSGRNIKDIRK